MATKSPAEENSERKRISIPKADESVLGWWDAQKDPGLSVRLLIRIEIERNGYTDAAYRPVSQLPRRGRPVGVGGEGTEDAGSIEDLDSLARPDYAAAGAQPTAPVAVTQPVTAEPVTPAQAPVPIREATPAPAPAQLVAAGGHSAIDDLMNG